MQGLTYGAVTRDILRPLFKTSAIYMGLLGACTALLLYGGYCWYVQLTQGLGVAGYQPPVFWGVYITTFVFWIGIGHAGTLISAVLFLFRSKWRTGVYRASEAMTIFAVMTAGLFPAIHVGRAWNAYWLFPYPNQRQLWQNFKSPLMWDVFAVSTYFSVSTIFFYIGLVPDIAAIRDRTSGVIHKIYSALAFGWRGTDRQWRHYMAAYGFFAAFATPLVLSVHSVVSWDFAMAQTMGWHSTLFPPYFVAGAIFSGCAMVITLLMPLSLVFKWEKYINVWHYEHLAKMCMLTGGILTYAYGTEYYIAYYSDNAYEWGVFTDRVVGDHGVLQLHRAAHLVDPEHAAELRGPLDRRGHHQRGHVVRAVQHHCQLAGPPVRSGRLDLLHPELGGVGHHGGQLRLVRPVVPPLRQGDAVGGHRRDQGAGPAAAQAG